MTEKRLLYTELKIYGRNGMLAFATKMQGEDRKYMLLLDAMPLSITITKIELENVYKEVEP